jgi:hypothetical protein
MKQVLHPDQASPPLTSLGVVASGITAGSDVAGIAASNVAMFQQFAANSTTAGVLASGLATKAGVLGATANLVGMADTAYNYGIGSVGTNSIVSFIGSALSVGASIAAAPEIVIGLGVAGAALTVAGLADLGTVGADTTALENALSAMSTAIQPYFNSLSADAQAVFQSSLTDAVQGALNGGVLVPTINSDGQIAGYSMQTPTSVVQQDNGSTISYFGGGVAVVSPVPGDPTSSSVWTIPQPGSNTPAELDVRGDGSYTYNTTAPDQSTLSLESSTADTGTGSTQNEEMIQTLSDGEVNATIGGDGAVADLNNANVTLVDGANATLLGDYNVVNVGVGSSATVDGSYNNVTGDNNSTVDFASGAEWNVGTMIQQGQVIIADNDT